MTDLPIADAATRAYFEQWLENFSGYVRAVDYASARPLWHPDVVTFGTHRDVVTSRETTIATQWDNVWPKTAEFRFDLAQTHVMASTDGSMAVVIAPWTSDGFHEDGTRFDRPGRATIVFARAGEEWLVVHSHMSLNRGVPQSSHANRPVKAR
jgi:ketosteroid isomerase-like protein